MKNRRRRRLLILLLVKTYCAIAVHTDKTLDLAKEMAVRWKWKEMEIFKDCVVNIVVNYIEVKLRFKNN